MMLTFHFENDLNFNKTTNQVANLYISGVQRGVLQLLQRDVGGAPAPHSRHLPQLPQHHRLTRHVSSQPGARQPSLAPKRLYLQPQNIQGLDF